MVPPSDQTSGQDDQAIRPRSPGADGGAVSDPTLDLVLRADLVSPSIARDRITAWLVGHGWPPAQTDDLVLALSEAVTNSCTHGYGVDVDTYDHPGLIRVRARILTGRAGTRVVELVVADDGCWRPPPDGVPPPGHGLFIIDATTAELIVDGSAEGTTVTIRSHPMPPQRHS